MFYGSSAIFWAAAGFPSWHRSHRCMKERWKTTEKKHLYMDIYIYIYIFVYYVHRDSLYIYIYLNIFQFLYIYIQWSTQVASFVAWFVSKHLSTNPLHLYQNSENHKLYSVHLQILYSCKSMIMCIYTVFFLMYCAKHSININI